MTKRYLGNIITQNPTAPAGPYEDGAAPGVWSLAEAFAYNKAGLWPTAGNVAQIALMFGGYNSSSSSAINNIQQIYMGTSGTSTDFGDLISPVYGSGTASSSTRAVKLGGTPNDNVRDRMEYVTIASQGNSVDFGDIDKQGANSAEYELCSGTLSNETRGLVGPGTAKPEVIDYFTIATTGNSTTFGGLYFGYNFRASCSSTTRGFIMGGRDGAAVSKTRIDMVVFASTGNYYSSYGDLTVARNTSAGTSSNTRGVIFGGQSSASPGTLYNIIDYFDLASSGNATDFGDLSAATTRGGAFSNRVYAYINGVGTTNLTVGTNVIEYVTIASTGNSTDFGDASVAAGYTAATSDSHGGLA